MENYEDEIRPVLANFCGWFPGIYHTETGRGTYIMPDPLHNTADAWALQRVLWSKGYCVEIHLNFDDLHHMRTGESRVVYVCNILGGRMSVTKDGDTPESALVLAAYAVAKENSPA